MDQAKYQTLQALITHADFLNDATKQVFLDKLPHLTEKKFADLYEIFNHDQAERKKLYERKVAAFEKYKNTVYGIYQMAKQEIIRIKEKFLHKEEKIELAGLDAQLKNL